MIRLLIGAVFLCLFPIVAGAQLLPNLYMMELAVKPQYPKGGETVTISVHNPSGRDDTAYVWIVNGKIQDQGVGRKTITVPAGEIGAVQTVIVQAIENGLVKGQVTAIVRPAEVDLVWEGKTMTPPFYAGLPLPSGMSDITAVAVPNLIKNGARIPEGSIVYTWSVDGKTATAKSGYGKSSITVTPPKFGQAFQLGVKAALADNSIAAETGIRVAPALLSAMVYEQSPLAGVLFNKEAGGLFLFTGEEVMLSAFPLFASRDALSYGWKLNGQSFELDPASPRSATFRKSGSGAGTHTVTFSFNNPAKFLEHADRSFQLSF